MDKDFLGVDSCDIELSLKSLFSNSLISELSMDYYFFSSFFRCVYDCLFLFCFIILLLYLFPVSAVLSPETTYSRVNVLCLLSFRYPFKPCVTDNGH